MTTAADNRAEINFVSVDSAPKRFAGHVPQWRAPASIALFIVVALGQLFLINLTPLKGFFPNHDWVFSPYEGHHVVAIRVFIISFFISFSAFAGGTLKMRFLFGLDLLITFFFVCAILDVINAVFYFMSGHGYGLSLTEIISGILGFAIYSVKLLEWGHMPARIRVEHRPTRERSALLRLFITFGIAVSVCVLASHADLPLVGTMREWALLGGIGPGVFLFLPVFFGQLYFLAVLDVLMMRPPQVKPTVSIIVPAHNESYIIERTINAMDKAAKHYGGDVRILIMNNNSTDDTAEIATRTLNACEAATGRVIDVPTPGKSHALNAGLDAADTELLVRVDADTLLGEDNLSRAIPYFTDPEVGVVGGVPIPPGGGLFDRARLLEVMVKHGFYSVAMGAIKGVVGIPGMFVVYRTEHPRYLGGFVEGMNGEDTDISLRIGELGFKSVVDPRIRYISEVPSAYEHMREQRMRWFRSIYHISSRCRDLIYSDWITIRGKIMLPYMLVNSARRAMLVPLICFGIIEYVAAFNPDSPLIWQAILAVFLGAPSLMAVVATLLNGMPRGLLCIPEYLIFRILRAYFTLESMMSISLSNVRQVQEDAFRKDVVPNKPIRVA
ncbi:Glycosyltransferase, catalytic subunit of cellulose synthase and poly-beta-1,6-N-acetylglucosamine synthase [Cognatiyoonia koreensis]|uniref:Glycosyltransferase, catalytic subunit of cellulose synthase and poly-beta-1,6-N-acetylglucosamine synthase n=1 Tax=Cognatiyoonia koreensis TaxID=364200 RepID=A0A1I0QWD4_9RHOB|nr:glycosyltransferase [Cognatiyoonia koreensis]SEW32066.1 Glycosyltransferase, catalytic subunit of cellulose synthase and poly-beta-1,6-N-acetylglucosamine synthase [Cognatiyoonia koreensis]